MQQVIFVIKKNISYNKVCYHKYKIFVTVFSLTFNKLILSVCSATERDLDINYKNHTCLIVCPLATQNQNFLI